MASFKDRVPEFNDYVAQQPVDAMVKVGMAKQQKYDGNLQKIQQTMSHVAGLQVGRDVDKEYLEKQIGDINNRLKVFAAGDFSNNNLTSSVRGMVGSIANDEVIQNSVRSTIAAQKAQKEQKRYTDKGEGSDSNDWLLGTQLSAWYEDPNPGATFSGTSRRYSDYKKKTLDIIKQLSPDSTITDDAFHYEGNKLVIHDAIVREEMSGISPEKIQQALLSGLSPSDWGQIEIDGRYTYSNTDDARFGARIQEQYDSTASFYAQERETLVGSLDDTKNIAEKAAITNQIKLLDNEISKSKRKYSGLLESIKGGNIESAKAQLFTSDFLQGISQAFSSTERKQTIENNPYAEMAFKRQSLDIKNRQWAADYNLNVAKFQQSSLDSAADRKLKGRALELKEQELTGFDASGGLPSSIAKEDLPERSLATIQNKIQSDNSRIATKDAEFSQGKAPGWLAKRYLEFNKTGTTSDPSLDEWFNEKRNLEKKTYSKQIVIDQIQTTADAKYGFAEDHITEEDLDTGIVVNVGGDGELVSSGDMVRFNTKIKNYYKASGSTLGDLGKEAGKFVASLGKEGEAPSSLTWDDEGAKNNLTPKEFALYEIYKRDVKRQIGEWDENVDGGVGLSKNITAEEESILNFSQQIKEKYNDPFDDILKEKLDYVSKKVSERISVTQGVDYPFTMKTPDLQAFLGGKLTSIANLMGETGEGFPLFEGEVDDVRVVAKGVKSGTIKVIEGNEYGDAQYILTASSDKKTVRIPLNETQKRSMFGNLYENSPEVRALQPFENQIRMMNGDRNDSGKTWGSTAFPEPNGETKPTNIQNSYLQGKTNFPQINAYGISGNIEKTESGLYSIKINIFDPVTKAVILENIPYPSNGLMDKEKVTTALSVLTDDYIFERLYGKPPPTTITNSEDLIKLFEE